MTTADPIDIALDIADLLESQVIPYVLSGSVASFLLSARGSIAKIELIADLTLQKLSVFLDAVQPQFEVTEAAVRNAITAKSSFSLVHRLTGSVVEIFILKDDRFSQSTFSRRMAKVLELRPQRSLRVPTVEDIILEKLMGYRRAGSGEQQEWRDVLWMMKLQNQDLDFEYLHEWASELNLQDLLDRALAEAGFE